MFVKDHSVLSRNSDMMIPRSFIAAVFLATITTAAVVDVEPPVFTFCPSDILIDNLTEIQVRVHWQQPIATDNSGDLPALTSNRQSGSYFSVPSEYQVVYMAVDGSHNVDSSCTFRITLKLKSCTIYPAPQNGAIACLDTSDGGKMCAVTCKYGFDFAFRPPLLYLCSLGKWNIFDIQPNTNPLPWPDCSVQIPSGSSLKMNISPFYYFDGDENDPNVIIEVIKNNFHNFLSSSLPFFCDPQQCSKEKVNVTLAK